MKEFAKEKLGLFPTPMHYLPNISKKLGTNVWIKRDDLCGVALGGNKVRKLEFLLADAIAKGYYFVMTTGQAQSNHAMLTAACAKRLGLDCILVLKERGITARKGNQILNYLMGAEVRFFSGISHSDRLPALTISEKRCILIEMPDSPWTDSMYRELEK